MNNKILDIQNLVMGYRKHKVIENITIDAAIGDLICIIGRNGTGKTTFLNTIAGLIPAISGKIYYNDVDCTKISLSERSKIISYVPSKHEYLSNFTIFDLISLGRCPHTNIFDKKTDLDNQIIENAIKESHLESIQHKPLYKISDGERQRAMICRAIVQQTPVILLDEPTSFLDCYAKQELLLNLAQLAHQKNKCVIFSCHDVELATKFADKVWLTNNAKISVFSSDEFLSNQIFEKLFKFNPYISC